MLFESGTQKKLFFSIFDDLLFFAFTQYVNHFINDDVFLWQKMYFDALSKLEHFMQKRIVVSVTLKNFRSQKIVNTVFSVCQVHPVEILS